MIHTSNSFHGVQIMKAAGAGFAAVNMDVISREENGELYGGVIYENYTGPGGSVLVHMAGFKPNWINRDMLWIMFDYPFVQLDCKQAYAQVPGKNTHTRNICKTFGWTELHVLEGVFPDDDMILLRMKRDECRFLKLKPRTVRSKIVGD